MSDMTKIDVSLFQQGMKIFLCVLTRTDLKEILFAESGNIFFFRAFPNGLCQNCESILVILSHLRQCAPALMKNMPIFLFNQFKYSINHLVADRIARPVLDCISTDILAKVMFLRNMTISCLCLKIHSRKAL